MDAGPQYLLAMALPADRCRIFRQLHESGCFVVPNPRSAISFTACNRSFDREHTQ
jgi:hypothetical protein